MPRKVHGFLHDEQGDKSAGRLFLLGCLLAQFGLIVFAAHSGSIVLVPEAYAWFTSLDLGIITWITGRAVASRFKFERKSQPEDAGENDTEQT